MNDMKLVTETTAPQTAPAAPNPPAPAVADITSGAAAAAPAAEAAAPEPNVMVQAVRSFEGQEGFKNPQSAPFEVSKLRAADLFAVGLIEYVDQSDEDAVINEKLEADAAAVKAAAEARRPKKK